MQVNKDFLKANHDAGVYHITSIRFRGANMRIGRHGRGYKDFRINLSKVDSQGIVITSNSSKTQGYIRAEYTKKLLVLNLRTTKFVCDANTRHCVAIAIPFDQIVGKVPASTFLQSVLRQPSADALLRFVAARKAAVPPFHTDASSEKSDSTGPTFGTIHDIVERTDTANAYAGQPGGFETAESQTDAPQTAECFTVLSDVDTGHAPQKPNGRVQPHAK